jgi:hypothetical protein
MPSTLCASTCGRRLFLFNACFSGPRASACPGPTEPLRNPVGRRSSGRSSESQDRLDHRRPAIHTCGIRSKGPAIRSAVDVDQLCGEPQPLGRKEIPLCTAAILGRVAKMSGDPGPAGMKLELPGNDKITRRQLKAVVKRGCERKRAVSFDRVRARSPFDQQSVTERARPASLVSLYLLFISLAV